MVRGMHRRAHEPNADKSLNLGQHFPDLSRVEIASDDYSVCMDGDVLIHQRRQSASIVATQHLIQTQVVVEQWSCHLIHTSRNEAHSAKTLRSGSLQL